MFVFEAMIEAMIRPQLGRRIQLVRDCQCVIRHCATAYMNLETISKKRQTALINLASFHWFTWTVGGGGGGEGRRG